MTLQTGGIALGVLLLLFPADRLLSRAVSLRTIDEFNHLNSNSRFRPWWWVPALWLDPLRAFAGAWLLRWSLDLSATRWDQLPKTNYVWFVALLGLGVVAQLFTRKGDGAVLLAPVGFVTGVAAALAPWPVAALSLLSAGLGLFGLRQFGAFFLFGAAALALLGLALDAAVWRIAPAAGVFAFPILMNLITGRPLELPTRDETCPAT